MEDLDQPLASDLGPVAADARRPLKVGIMLPESEREMAGQTARWDDLREMTETIEECGFDSVWFADHLLMRVPGNEPQGAWECWSVLSALAVVTRRIEIAPFVTSTGYRNPALLAKIAETVDEISGGRLILGIGSGWAEPEYAAFGFPFDHRAGRFEEALTIIAGLIRDGRVDVEGAYYSAKDCELRPRGPRSGKAGGQTIPIMVGTFSGERMMRLTAKHADHWNVWANVTGNRAAGIPPLMETMDGLCREIDRDPATLERSCAVMVDFENPYGRPGQPVPSLTGTTRELADEYLRYAEAGISHIQLYPDPCTVDGIKRCAEALELLT